ncbi:MAG: hypothetical protein AAB584_00340 [Patescibacteria group bacterium]
MKQRLQIHIDGAKRAGKTTVAKGIIEALRLKGLKPALVDMDEIRMKIFGENTGKPDSAESLGYRHWVARAMCKVMAPAVLDSGGIPVVVMDHDFVETYEYIKELSRRFGFSLKFIVLESPDLEEAKRRSEFMLPDDYSDMKNWSDPAIRASFLRSAGRIDDYYKNIAESCLIRIPQSSVENMIREAVRFVFDESE